MSRTIGLVFIVLASLSFGSVPRASAQQTTQTPATPPTRDPQAVSALTTALNTMQGNSLVNTTNGSPVAVAITGTYSSATGTDTSPHPLRIEILGLNQIRWDAQEPEGTYTTIFENGAGWRWGPNGSQTLAIRESIGRQLEILPILAVANWITASTEYSCQMVDTETVNGRSALHLSISEPPPWTNDAKEQAMIQNATKVDFYLDSQNGTPVRLHYNEHPRDWRVNVPIDLDFSNYQQVSGVLMPMTIDRSTSGIRLGEFQFTSVTFNASIPPTDF